MPGGRVNHPIFARWYARLSPAMERGGFEEYRRLLLAGLAGSVLEVGAGNGLNFGHYPPEARVLAVEPEAHLRGLARQAAADAPVRVEVVDGIADRLPAEDESFDAVVVSLVLCSVPSQRVALAEVRRVLRPGGELRFLEHVRAGTPWLRRVQRLLDGTVWPLTAGGCHLGRDTATAIENAGFTIDHIERFTFPKSSVPMPSSPHIVGTARRV